MTSDPTVQLGVVGCGAVVREYHLPALTEEPGINVRVLCDRAVENADAAKRQFGLDARTTASLEDLAGEVEVALVAVPPRFHAPVTIRLLELGIPVLCEKPLATTAAEAGRMIEAARRHDRLLSVGLMTRFHPNNGLLRDLLQDGILGEVEEVVAENGAPLDWAMTSPSYYSRETTAGGVFFDAGVHLVDRVLWLFGDMEVAGYEDDSYGGVESNASLRGVLKLGGRHVPCRVTCSWTHTLDNCIRVVGSAATAEIRLGDPNAVTLRRRLAGQWAEMRVTRGHPQTRPDGAGPFREQMRDFVRAVRERRDPFVRADSAVGALHVIEKAYSIRTRMPQPWVEATR